MLSVKWVRGATKSPSNAARKNWQMWTTGSISPRASRKFHWFLLPGIITQDHNIWKPVVVASSAPPAPSREPGSSVSNLATTRLRIRPGSSRLVRHTAQDSWDLQNMPAKLQNEVPSSNQRRRPCHQFAFGITMASKRPCPQKRRFSTTTQALATGKLTLEFFCGLSEIPKLNAADVKTSLLNSVPVLSLTAEISGQGQPRKGHGACGSWTIPYTKGTSNGRHETIWYIYNQSGMHWHFFVKHT